MVIDLQVVSISMHRQTTLFNEHNVVSRVEDE